MRTSCTESSGGDEEKGGWLLPEPLKGALSAPLWVCLSVPPGGKRK